MAISAPRQRTTFKKDKKTGKVKGTTTYRAPEMEKASEQLDRYIRDNQNKKNEAPGIESILQDMPEKRAEFVRRNTVKNKDGTFRLNQAALAMLAPYQDERPEYSRGLNRLVKSSPEMAKAYAERFPKTNFAMNLLPSALPFVGPLFTADKAIKANRRKQEILNTPVNRPDGGFKNFVDFFAKGMTPDQAKNTEIISGETLRLSPQDIFNKSEPMTEEQKANVAADLPFRSPQDMGFLDDENIFDSEKAAIDAALTPGNVFDPVAADKQSKVDFINQVENTNMTVDRAEQVAASNGMTLNDVFERSKQKQGGIIREEVNRDLSVDDEDPIPGGQFNLTSPTVDENTAPLILGGAGPDYDYGDFMVNEDLGNVIPTDNMFPEGGVSGTPVTQAGQELVFSDGTPVTQPVNTGLDMVGDKAFPNSPGSQEAMDILNSNADPYFSGYPTMRFNEGGSTNKYENMSTHEKLMRMAAEMYG
jgi:hypothetical protein